jgi:hypothetical protein
MSNSYYLPVDTMLYPRRLQLSILPLSEPHMRTDHLIPGLISFRGSYNMQQSGNKAGQVETLCKCTCINGSRYLPAFALWKPLSEHLPAVCVESHDGGESSAACASISVFVWGKLVLKHTKCCKQLSESPA